MHLENAKRTSLDACPAAEVRALNEQCEVLLAKKLRMASQEAAGYGLGASAQSVNLCLACLASLLLSALHPLHGQTDWLTGLRNVAPAVAVQIR